jgi:DNA polymerase III delta subunit
LDKKILERIAAHGGKVQEFEKAVDTNVMPSFTVFSIADAFGKRDKKQTWALYREALHKGISPEEIHSILMWQIKSMLLSINVKTAEKAGLSPFVYKKSKVYAEKYGKEKLKEVSRDFLISYHNMRRGLVDMETALELQILNI